MVTPGIAGVDRDQAAESQLWFDRALRDSPVMAILRGHGPERTVDLARRAWSAGIDLIEVPLQSATDLESLRAVCALAAENGHSVGAGTVITHEQVDAARRAGASFIVSPGLDADIVRAGLAAGLHPLPGVATATEIQQAVALGLRWLKAFPATGLGTAWFQAMRGPFPRISLVAVGGVDAVNADGFFAAGADAIAVGSALADPSQLERLAEYVRST
ncbi:2-dehydro-3-deoxy-6-phosphogalactonate aldolase [Catenulispora yoronensis]|uniref:2-dehydro-3-deoxy-6-phosphogalactonate aldolase n=1 Tax=Catenulispora yoronensis TaxID=450799 RepID=A0ABN2TSS1_9ACTN